MISTKGRYALRVMIDLAEHKNEGNISLKSISERQTVSKKYLEIIVKSLVQGGLIAGISGKGGGYHLIRAPHEYTIGEIIELMEGNLTTVACLMPDAKPCDRSEQCQTLPLWREFDTMVHNYFYGKTLNELL